MKKTIHPALSRGFTDHGWLKSYHTFSFSGYYHPSRTNFGLLRVLNDDAVSPGMGFGEHPHQNMEIISIPLEGALEHKDSTGAASVMRPGEVQIMSAGSGVSHSEFNHSPQDPVKFLQIWLFPKEMDIDPRYQQKRFDAEGRENHFQLIVSPEKAEESLWVNQDAWLSLADIHPGHKLQFHLHDKRNGVYFFVVEGEGLLAGEHFGKRDGLGIEEAGEEAINIEAHKRSTVLAIEVPMLRQ